MAERVFVRILSESDVPEGREKNMAIERKYYQLNFVTYYLDFLTSTTLFVISFTGFLYFKGTVSILFYILSIFTLYRATAFIHEATHQERNPDFRTFVLVLNLTIGAITLVPAYRFFKPHNIHHTTGIFRTNADPQYLLVRSNTKFALFLFLLIPFIMPLVNLFFAITASPGGILDAEGMLERFLKRRGYIAGTGSEFPEEYKRPVMWLSLYSLVMYGIFFYFFPWSLPYVYAVHVGAWFLGTLRIPLEHRMDYYVEKSDEHDQIVDSFTVESIFAELLQPLSLRLHTAHHLYPGVPYHNLPALHRELKRTNETYRKSIVSFWEAVRGPGWGLPSGRRDAMGMEQGEG